MINSNLESLINKKIDAKSLRDYTINGLQVEGCKNVNRIVTGVTACQALLDTALEYNADAIIVHHGLFWKNDNQVIRGAKRKRLKTLLENNINLYSWHLPLDVHPEIGNNAQLAVALGIRITNNLDQLVLQGEFDIPTSGRNLCLHLEKVLGRRVFHFDENLKKSIKKVAWCTGAGQKFIELAAQSEIDAFITGEMSEQTIHIAREYKIHFYSAGHHATEKGGILALGNWLINNYDLDIKFIDIPNPA